MLDLNVYGKTPGAMYLARTLNELNDISLTRNVGKQIHATTKVVRELIEGYEAGHLSPKTVANTLRLMREEVSGRFGLAKKLVVETGKPSKSKHALVDQLKRNVQIGYIKQGIRLATIARKAERVMANPLQRGTLEWMDEQEAIVQFTDQQSGKVYDAGIMWGRIQDEDKVFETSTPTLEEIGDVTPEVLHERSERRCIRLGKAHTINKE